jgi:hypothetical protein
MVSHMPTKIQDLQTVLCGQGNQHGIHLCIWKGYYMTPDLADLDGDGDL